MLTTGKLHDVVPNVVALASISTKNECIPQSFYYEVVSFFRIIKLAKHNVFLSADVNVEKKQG